MTNSSITGPYLALLGAGATVVGIVAGFGELIGLSLRLVFGYISDRTGRYWTITLLGYALNLLAVPLLALAGHWEVAALLMITERLGKAIRIPARDAMLSYATTEMGRGWGYGLHEAMDQIGAVLGPLIVAAVLYFRGEYRVGFGVLLIPALLAMAVLVAAPLALPPSPRTGNCHARIKNQRIFNNLLALPGRRGLDCRRLRRLSVDCLPLWATFPDAPALDSGIVCRGDGRRCAGRPALWALV